MPFFAVLVACAIASNAIAAGAADSPDPDSPWFAGSLLAPNSTTISPGHFDLDLYLIYFGTNSHYDSRGHTRSQQELRSWSSTLIGNVGLSERLDLVFSVPYAVNSSGGKSDHGFGDIDVGLHFQLLDDDPGSWRPGLLLSVAEVFPTGKHDALDPKQNGTDSMGAGSYQTRLTAVLRKLWSTDDARFLHTCLALSYTIPSQVDLEGFNAFGGTADTDGSLDLGNQFTTILSFEYTLTRNWVPAIDFVYRSGAASQFLGFPGTTDGGMPAEISTSSSSQFSIAPAIEYNFSESKALTVGVWFSVAGRNSDGFVSTMAAFNYYY